MSLNPCITDWPAQRVWVVGASSGIGHALAKALLDRGARVAVSARNAAPLAALASQFPGTALAVAMDITRPDDWRDAHARIVAQWGAVDVLVFCAAAYHPVRAWDIDTDLAARMIDTNLTSAIRGIATVLPGMLGNRRGH
ncbi:MAG: SDR family oxidoreductase, partial [Gammaproteobacteria bacterium]